MLFGDGPRLHEDEIPRPCSVVVGGPTATGKTGVAIEIALAILATGRPAAVITADSRQVYRGMDVGTAKPTIEERRGVPHHGLDLVEPDEPFSVADFVGHAAAVLDDIAGAEGVAVLAGGTGFWIAAVAGGLPVERLPWDPAVRAAVESELARDGLPSLAARLRRLAPGLAARIDPRNPRRVVRALEIATLVGDAALPEHLATRAGSALDRQRDVLRLGGRVDRQGTGDSRGSRSP